MNQTYTDIIYGEIDNLSIKLPVEFNTHENWFLQIHAIWFESLTYFSQEYIVSLNCNLIQSFTRNSLHQKQTIQTPLQIFSFVSDQKQHKHFFTNNSKYFINNPSSKLKFDLNLINFPYRGKAHVGIHFTLKRF